MIDLALLVQAGELVADRVNSALAATFERRATHAVPRQLDPPPVEWIKQFADLSENCLAGLDMDDAFRRVRAFYEGLEQSEP